MLKIDQEFLHQSREVFASNRCTTLQDIRDSVSLSPATKVRRDALSALDTTARIFGRDLDDIQANWRSIRLLYGSKTAGQANLKPKRFANIRSDVLRAVRQFGGVVQPITRRIPLSPEWKHLFARIDKLSYVNALTRFACFCSYMNVAPNQVSQTAVRGFFDALEAEEAIKSPRRILKHTIAHWNMCRRRVAGWPAITLASPFPKTSFVMPATAFPKSFQLDLAQWRSRLLDVDFAGDDGPDAPLRLVTVDADEKRLIRFASVLVLSGTLKAVRVKNLAVLVQIANFRSGLSVFLKRANGKPTGYVAKYASLLLSVGRHHCKMPAESLKEHGRISARLRKQLLRGMTDKNRAILECFERDANVRKLLGIPGAERALGLKAPNHLRQAKHFERALAVGILIYGSLRIQNLRSIHMTKNIRWSNGTCIIFFAPEEMKNGRRLEFELPDEIGVLLKEYVRDHRKHLSGAEGPYLFPGIDCGARSGNTMRADFEATTLRHLGFSFNPHTMRHVMGKIVCEIDPGLLEAYIQHLGDSRDIALVHYLETGTRASGRPITRILEQKLKSSEVGEP